MANNPLVFGSIQVLSGKQAGTVFPISQPTINIGRDPNQNDIILEDDNVSRSHARIMQTGSQWYIENLSRKSSITINITTDVVFNHPNPTAISNGDTICLGKATRVRLFISSANQPLPNSAPISQHQNKTHRVGIPSLEISTNISKDTSAHQLFPPIINIGRDLSNDIIIDSPVVSYFHIQIKYEGNEIILIHPHPSVSANKTTNGLLYQGRYIRGNEFFRHILTHGDLFRIGDENGTFVTLTYNDGSMASQDLAPTIHPIQLGAFSLTIGRLPGSTVVLDHPQVSAQHAELKREQGTYRITDLNSTNHTYVNSRRIISQLLKQNDEIRIGPFKLIYEGNELKQYDESTCIRIDAFNLKKFGNDHKVLINDISIAIPPRRFVALVGGSGTGKSTLMDALNGLRPSQGTVLYNGKDYYRSLAAFSTQLGYVPQDDIVHRDLSVERALYYSAKMRLPADFTEVQINQRIIEVLEEVDLTDRRKMLVSKLSGGQRKRVSIALELLVKPSVFFLDEPTSGLDPGLDRKMMFLLRRLADKGHTIVLVTHATNNINACDYVCFLAQDGRLAYFGPPNEAKKYFGKADFAEIYGELEPSKARPNAPEEAEQKFKNSPDYQQYVVDLLSQSSGQTSGQRQVNYKKRTKGSNPWKQFALLCLRYLELLKNDKGYLATLLLQAPVIGLILMLFIYFGISPNGFDSNNVVQCPTTAQVITTSGFPDIPSPSNPAKSMKCNDVKNFLKNNPRGQAYAAKRGGEQQALQDFVVTGLGDAPKLLFIMAFAAILFGCVNAAREIVKEAPIYRRERTVNLGIMPYIFSKIVVLGILCLAQSFVLVAMVHIVDNFHQGIFASAFLEVYITLALSSLAGLMVGLTVSAIAPNNDRAMSLIPIILIPQVIFSGALFPLKGWFIQLLGMLFPIRWAMAALGTSVGLHSDKLGGDKLFGDNYTYHGILFSIYSQTDATSYLLLMWLALTVMIIILSCMTAYFLKRKDKRT